MKVAIVDDDPIVCTSIGTVLTATNTAEVIWSAHDGAAAVREYDRHAPDVLLIDVQMPGMDGLRASETILSAHPDARILVLTTFADPEYIRKAVELHTKGYLIKQDVASVIPAVQAVMAGQVVLGAEVLQQLPIAQPAQPRDTERNMEANGWPHMDCNRPYQNFVHHAAGSGNVLVAAGALR